MNELLKAIEPSLETAYQSLKSQVSDRVPEHLTIDSLRLQIAQSRILPPDALSLIRHGLSRHPESLEGWLRLAAFVAAIQGLGLSDELREHFAAGAV